ELLLEVRPHADGIYVGIKPFAQPLSTGGTRAAVRFLTAWLQEDGRRLLTRSF
ncbi:MAG: tRNA (guanine-N7)-methyltransferase, partial [Bacteroidetes bacterium]|nr:tRNA (guanine-N7)-methyltransferase [Bacteroidota bacterium]